MGYTNNTAHIRRNQLSALARLVDGGMVSEADAWNALRRLMEFQTCGADFPDYSDGEMNPVLAAFFELCEYSFNDLGLSTAMGEKSGEIRAQKAKAGKSSEPPKKSRGGFRSGSGRKSSAPQNPIPNDGTGNQIGNQKESNGEIKAESKESNAEIKGNQTALARRGSESNGNQTQSNKDKDTEGSSVRPSDGTDGRTFGEDASDSDSAREGGALPPATSSAEDSGALPSAESGRGMDERVVEAARSGDWAASLKMGLRPSECDWDEPAAGDARMLLNAYGRILGTIPFRSDERGKVWSCEERMRYWLGRRDADKVREMTAFSAAALMHRDRLLAMPSFRTIPVAAVDALRNGAKWADAKRLGRIE